ncbi:parathyroid hormone/parathyroid hormone-related peptide receptor-like [Lethenteron reissneri]|uniref:parathyroid hormone/parathyroid hormone-related peptide receptor-like n=1 Tax=Lethenteron reissneri TaxID=7753 RepID=UPI002AB5F231|nr:parathyroid hormone/parathyroid hormone-related peptide receptor-like [Lethenteron reissneri]
MNATEVGAAASLQMDADDVLTKEGQMLLLLVPRQQCESIIHSFNHTPGSLCPPEWDAIFCWPPTLPGQWVNVSCPHYIYDFNHNGQAYRRCDDGGQWLVAPNQNKTWTNYNECMQMGSHDDNLEEIHRLYTLSTIGYSVSMASLFVALSILAYLKKLHCTRNYIHMHLFVSFILRGASFFVCNIMIEAAMPRAGAVVGSWAEGGDADAILLEELRTFTAVPTLDKSPYLGCKLSVIFFLYFLATNYYWVFAEGLYLHSLVFMSFFSNRTKHLWTYIFIGWGFPTLFVGAWAVVRAVLADTRCWNINAGNIKWIYQAPMIIANTVNFAFFVNIVRVLATKLRETNAGRYDARRQYTKLAKSSLVLTLLFGAHYMVFAGMSESVDGWLWKARMYFDMFFNSLQGLFVAIIYCFCNGEVQNEIRKAWAQWNLAQDLDRRSRRGSGLLGTGGGHRAGASRRRRPSWPSSAGAGGTSQQQPSTHVCSEEGAATEDAGKAAVAAPVTVAFFSKDPQHHRGHQWRSKHSHESVI